MKTFLICLISAFSILANASEMKTIVNNGEANLEIIDGVSLDAFSPLETREYCYTKTKFDVCKSFFDSSFGSVEVYEDGGHGFVETLMCTLDQSGDVSVKLNSYNDYEGKKDNVIIKVGRCSSEYKAKEEAKLSISSSVVEAAHAVNTQNAPKNLKALKAAWVKMIKEVKDEDAYDVLFMYDDYELTCDEYDRVTQGYDMYLASLERESDTDWATYLTMFEMSYASISRASIEYAFSGAVLIPEYGDTCNFNLYFDINRKTGLAENIQAVRESCGGAEIPYDLFSHGRYLCN